MKMAHGNFSYQWITRRDADAFLGLLFDGFSKILAITATLLFVIKLPVDITLGRILPAIGLSVLLGLFWYIFAAFKLAYQKQDTNVTAQPFGLGATQSFGWLFLIILPVYQSTKDALLAWQIGIAACFLGGIFQASAVFWGKFILRIIPSSALLGNMAAGSFIWLGLQGCIIVFNHPAEAVLPLFIVLFFIFGNFRHVRVPIGLIAVLIGVLLTWYNDALYFQKITESAAYMKFYPPELAVHDVLAGFTYVWDYLHIVIPLQIANIVSTLQSLKSAEVAGDKYPASSSLFMDGACTILGSSFGSPFPCTIYWGHPGWKHIGARSGYLVLTAVAYVSLFFGLPMLIGTIIPYYIAVIFLITIGFITAAQAFEASDRKYYPVIYLSFVPVTIQFIHNILDTVLAPLQRDIKSLLFELEYQHASLQGIYVLSQGGFLSSLILASLLAFVIAQKYVHASITSVIAALFAFVGLIHAPKLALQNPLSNSFMPIYAMLALICFALHINHRKNYIEHITAELKEITEGDVQ